MDSEEIPVAPQETLLQYPEVYPQQLDAMDTYKCDLHELPPIMRCPATGCDATGDAMDLSSHWNTYHSMIRMQFYCISCNNELSMNTITCSEGCRYFKVSGCSLFSRMDTGSLRLHLDLNSRMKFSIDKQPPKGWLLWLKMIYDFFLNMKKNMYFLMNEQCRERNILSTGPMFTASKDIPLREEVLNIVHGQDKVARPNHLVICSSETSSQDNENKELEHALKRSSTVGYTMVQRVSFKQELYSQLYIRGCLNMETILTGSSHEGIPLEGCGDIDEMFTLRAYPVVLEKMPPEHTIFKYGYVLAYSSLENPAFPTLKVIDTSNIMLDLSKCMTETGFLSSKLFMKSVYEQSHTDENIHGPAITSQIVPTDSSYGSRDTVPCLYSPVWPEYARDFKEHDGALWPSREDLRKALKEGCRVVAVGHPKSASKDLEWRWSFSEAERKLMHSLNDSMRGCVFSLKLALRRTKEMCMPRRGLFQFLSGMDHKPFCSYFLKTGCFWVFETCSTKCASPSFDLCCKVIKYLVDCFQGGILPHYFITGQNLIGHLSRAQRQKVVNMLTYIKDNLASIISSDLKVYLPRIKQHTKSDMSTDVLGCLADLTSEQHLVSRFLGNDLDMDGLRVLLILEDLKKKLPFLVPDSYIDYFTAVTHRWIGDIHQRMYLNSNNCIPHYSDGRMLSFSEQFADNGLSGLVLIAKHYHLQGNKEAFDDIATELEDLVFEYLHNKQVELTIPVSSVDKYSLEIWRNDTNLYQSIKDLSDEIIRLSSIDLGIYLLCILAKQASADIIYSFYRNIMITRASNESAKVLGKGTAILLTALQNSVTNADGGISQHNEESALAGEEVREFQYDAYIAFESSHVPFVISCVERLEKMEQYKVFVRARDLLPGVDNYQKIAATIDQSRTAIVVIPHEYSALLDFEINLVHSLRGAKRLLFISLENSDECTTRYSDLQLCEYIKYPNASLNPGKEIIDQIVTFMKEARQNSHMLRKQLVASLSLSREDGDDFRYDAFIIYSDIHQRFVHGHCLRELEQKDCFHLCIHHRDFMIGNAIIDNITDAVKMSRKVIVVIPVKESKWITTEIELSLHIRGVHNMLFISLCDSEVTPKIRNYVKLCEHVKYTKSKDPEGQIISRMKKFLLEKRKLGLLTRVRIYLMKKRNSENRNILKTARGVDTSSKYMLDSYQSLKHLITTCDPRAEENRLEEPLSDGDQHSCCIFFGNTEDHQEILDKANSMLQPVALQVIDFKNYEESMFRKVKYFVLLITDLCMKGESFQKIMRHTLECMKVTGNSKIIIVDRMSDTHSRKTLMQLYGVIPVIPFDPSEFGQDFFWRRLMCCLKTDPISFSFPEITKIRDILLPTSSYLHSTLPNF